MRFQLLGLKGFERDLLEWDGEYFIIDKIHAYNSTVFARLMALIEFIQHYLILNKDYFMGEPHLLESDKENKLE